LVAQTDLLKEIPDSSLRNAKFVWIPALKEEHIQGELKEFASKSGVESVRIPGYWQYKVGTVTEKIESPKEGEKVVLHIHGGAMYVSTLGLPRFSFCSYYFNHSWGLRIQRI